ncbi:hypothetical protein [Acidithiobacillus sp.]|uniref:hypothetical protein n=1 Tax=Acidithiobacillus sp. TaxID=1872118 RepID=UPI0025C4CAB8|nr:hypothetical protein [Acidithiobacillus sp.]
MSAYLWGNLLGRLVFSWLVVWLFALVFKKGRIRAALRASVWPWGWLFVLLLFVLSIAGAVLRSQGAG